MKNYKNFPKFENVLKNKDLKYRDNLQHILITKEHVIFTDAHILGVLQNDFINNAENINKEYMLHFEQWQLINKNKIDCLIFENDKLLCLKNTVKLFELDLKEAKGYPDYKAVINKETESKTDFGLNIEYLYNLCEILFFEETYKHTVKLELKARNQTHITHSAGKNKNFGLIMNIFLQN